MAQLLPYSWTRLDWMVFSSEWLNPAPLHRMAPIIRAATISAFRQATLWRRLRKLAAARSPPPLRRPPQRPLFRPKWDPSPPPSGPKRFLQAMLPVAVMLTFELNVFFLKYALWVPPTNPLNTYRLILWWGGPLGRSGRETNHGVTPCAIVAPPTPVGSCLAALSSHHRRLLGHALLLPSVAAPCAGFQPIA
jgi:hypothetical protein